MYFISGAVLEPLIFIAPILQDVDVSFQVVRFNGSFLQENVYRQNASPEVDAAWKSLGPNCKDVNFVHEPPYPLDLLYTFLQHVPATIDIG